MKVCYWVLKTYRDIMLHSGPQKFQKLHCWFLLYSTWILIPNINNSLNSSKTVFKWWIRLLLALKYGFELQIRSIMNIKFTRFIGHYLTLLKEEKENGSSGCTPEVLFGQIRKLFTHIEFCKVEKWLSNFFLFKYCFYV